MGGLRMPRLLLITASSPEIRRVRRSRVLNFQQITMPYLAARVPARWQVTHVDEEAEEIDRNFEADVVGNHLSHPKRLRTPTTWPRISGRGESAWHWADRM